MKLASYKNRAFCVQTDSQNKNITGIELASASEGVYCTMRDILENWDEFSHWYKEIPAEKQSAFKRVELRIEELEAPVPCPRQIFAVGMNYKSHASEIGLALPQTPSIFTKFASSIGRPCCAVKL